MEDGEKRIVPPTAMHHGKKKMSLRKKRGSKVKSWNGLWNEDGSSNDNERASMSVSQSSSAQHSVVTVISRVE